MHLIAYIDNILVLAESQELAKYNVESVLYVLQCLGFLMNSVLGTAQSMEFLGLTVDTVTMELKLPVEKIKICAEARSMATADHTSVRAIASWWER